MLERGDAHFLCCRLSVTHPLLAELTAAAEQDVQRKEVFLHLTLLDLRGDASLWPSCVVFRQRRMESHALVAQRARKSSEREWMLMFERLHERGLTELSLRQKAPAVSSCPSLINSELCLK